MLIACYASAASKQRRAIMTRPALRHHRERFSGLLQGRRWQGNGYPRTVPHLTRSPDWRLSLLGLKLALTEDGITNEVNVDEDGSYRGESGSLLDGRHGPARALLGQ